MTCEIIKVHNFRQDGIAHYRVATPLVSPVTYNYDERENVTSRNTD